LATIKQLAGQTLWYGISNIGAKFLNYLLTPLLTYLMTDTSGVQDYGDYSLLYSWIAVVNILFVYGFETGYFRFSNKDGIDRKSLFETAFGSLIISTLGLFFLFSFLRMPINNFLNLGEHPEYITWCLCLIGLDAISTIPFAKLRQENRPKKYALIKLCGILINILFTLFFLIWLPKYADNHSTGSIAMWASGNSRVGFLLLSNVLQNLFVFVMLYAEWKDFRFKFNGKIWRQLFLYSMPMIFIGLAGMINEVMDRQMLAKLLPVGIDAKRVVGIYSANYKLAIFITLFVQAFKMAAEPFFFNQSKEKNATLLYARVMKWFVITLSLAFLFSALYLDLLQYMIGVSYRSGLTIVPILLFANICLGIYYNLSVWYKLTDRMRMGLYITSFGAIITLTGNYFFIPLYGMYAAAWTTLVCYATMVIITYFMGQRYFPVPYPVKRILTYLSIMLVFYFIKISVDSISGSWTNMMQLLVRVPVATLLIILYILIIVRAERKELKTMPFIGKLIA